MIQYRILFLFFRSSFFLLEREKRGALSIRLAFTVDIKGGLSSKGRRVFVRVRNLQPPSFFSDFSQGRACRESAGSGADGEPADSIPSESADVPNKKKKKKKEKGKSPFP